MSTGRRAAMMGVAGIAIAAVGLIAAPRAAGLILGQVVDAESGRPVAGVVVALSVAAAAGPAPAELIDLTPAPASAARRSLTTSDGRFLFRDLAKGRYTLTTTASGYTPGAYGQGRPSGPSQPIDLGDDEKAGMLSVRVWKLGAVGGTVLDESGEPAVGVSVNALKRAITGGHPRFVSAGSASTDDRGMYRIASLVPGDYVVGITVIQDTAPMSAVNASIDAGLSAPRNNSEAYRSMTNSAAGISSSASGFRVGELVLRQGGGRPAPAPDGRIMAYQTQFYPAAAAASQASLVSLKSGDDRRGVDLQLKLVPSVRVSGRVRGPSGPGAFLGMTLVPPSGSDLTSEGSAQAARTVTDETGAFTFLGIPAGQYLLKIRMYPHPETASSPGAGAIPLPPPAEPTLWALMPISVGDRDITDLAVTLKAGLAMTGRVEFVGSRPAPPPDQIQRLSITLQSAEGRTSSPIATPGRAAADLSFRTAGYPGGRYVAAVATLPMGWTLKSVMSGGRDVSVEPLELTDADVKDVVITFTDLTTELSGVVTGARGPEANAEVIVFPADSAAWKDIGVVARRGRNVRPSGAGAFSMSGLPPGAYFVAAVPVAAIGDWQDPVFLERLVATATRVSLGDGEKRTVDLKLLTMAARTANGGRR